MKTHNIYSLLIVAGIAMALAGCSGKNEPVAAAESADEHFIALTAEQERLAGITFGEIKEEDVEQSLACSGVVDVPPANRISVTTVYGGYITYTGVYPGDKIVKGQLLAKIQDPVYIDLQRSYLEGLGKLAFLEADYKRKSDLVKTESVSEKQYQDTKREFDAVKVEVSSLAAQLRMAGLSPEKITQNGVQAEVEVRSPINGFVTAVNINQGLHLTEGQELFTLINPDHVHVELSVYPNDLGKLAEGQRVYFRLAGSDAESVGTIKLINKAVSDGSKSITVHVHPDDEDAVLLPGAFVQARIVVSVINAKVLPLDAITETENGYVAYKKADGGVLAIYFAPRFVASGFADAAGLEEGIYVRTGAEKLVKIEEEEGHEH
jgi:cobalt-zinc-cadmium efflux system membrane fusion protein